MSSVNDQYVDQSAEDLWLQVTSISNLDLEYLKVIRSKNLTICDGLSVEAGVLGTSHYVQVKSEKQRLAEVFSCVSLRDDSETLCNTRATNLLQVEHSDRAICHKFSVETVDWTEGKQRYNNLYNHTSTSEEVYLKEVFPSLDDDCGDFLPVTIVHIVAEDNMIHCRTLHSYPNEGKLVFSTSQFTLDRSLLK